MKTCKNEWCDNVIPPEADDEDEQQECPKCIADYEREKAHFGAMYRREHPPIAQGPKPICPTCQNTDGTPNTDLLGEEGACVFDGNHRIDPDFGYCPSCGDHAANQYECETCGRTWGDWNAGKWELVS